MNTEKKKKRANIINNTVKMFILKTKTCKGQISFYLSGCFSGIMVTHQRFSESLDHNLSAPPEEVGEDIKSH